MSAIKWMKLGVIPLAAFTLGCEHQVSFKSEVHPIFEQHCMSCHAPGGEGYAKSGFSVVSYPSIMKGTKYAEVIVPGSSISSTLVRLIRHEADPSIAMPKNHQAGKPSDWLSQQEIQLVSAWIDQGAKDN